MIRKELSIAGCFILEPEKHEDHRGFFLRAWCRHSLRNHGISADFLQCNVSYSKKKGTRRGLHYQREPHQEAKLVRCTTGALYDVVVDLRPTSPTYGRWASLILRGGDQRFIYIPEGLAHGYQTLEDETEVMYFVTAMYAPGFESGIRWNDPGFKIEWPHCDVVTISSKDDSWPDFKMFTRET